MQPPWVLFPNDPPFETLTATQGPEPFVSAWWEEYLRLDEPGRQAYLDAHAASPAWRQAVAEVTALNCSMTAEELEADMRESVALQTRFVATKPRRWWQLWRR